MIFLAHRICFVFFALVGVSQLASTACAEQASAPSQNTVPDFSKVIRPILAAKCFACHGPDEQGRQGGFRLDQLDSAISEADSGATPIKPGDPTKSEILSRILSEDESLRMPPVETNKKVSPEEVRLLRTWVAAGAPWGDHWAFEPPEVKSSVAVDSTSSVIDWFIDRQIRKRNLHARPHVDRQTLVRRVSLGITGLPPTIEEARAFVVDTRPDAYLRLVRRLLASPAYGEHMARYWLDAARYADTHGLNLDNYREMWLYRDWVINAFNSNYSYDRFVTEQLAGDLLANPTQDQLIATGFNRCHLSTGEGGSIVDEVRARNVSDRVDTFGSVFLGLTIGCARCHDHKYDPTTALDYYALFAFFNSLDGPALDKGIKDPAPVIRRPTSDQQIRLAEIANRLPQINTQLKDAWPEVDQAQFQWEEAVKDALVNPKEGQQGVQLGDWYLAAGFYQSNKGIDRISEENFRTAFGPERGEINLNRSYPTNFGIDITWKRKAKWEDGVLRNDLPTNKDHSTVCYLHRKVTASEAMTLRASIGVDDGVKVFLNGKLLLERNTYREAEPHQEMITLDLQQGKNDLLIKIVNYKGKSGFFFTLPDDPTVIPKEVLDIIASRGSQIDVPLSKQQAILRKHFRDNVCQLSEVVKLRRERNALLVEKDRIKVETPTTLVFREMNEPRPAFVLLRGEYNQLGPQVKRNTPTFLPPMDSQLPRDRLGLARWLFGSSNSRPHPLTARVFVNRIWQQLFGVGLVPTAGDFGSQGDLPSHPELLDWLAIDFFEHGWDIKRLVEQIVCSDAYQRTAHTDAALDKVDPTNRWLTRFPRRRLDAEALRDQALAVSGLLVRKVGGPSVKPPQPKGLWSAVGYTRSNTSRFHADLDPEKRHRRTLYTFIKRTAGAPQMMTFDAPSRESCVVRRERTNTPLQALLLLNDIQFLEAAMALAERAMQLDATGVEQRVQWLFQVCLCRLPTDEELASLSACYKTELRRFESNQQQAFALLSSLTQDNNISDDKRQKLDSSVACRHAAWTLVANVLMNLDEFVSQN